MDLATVAGRFDLTPMWDAYSGQLLKHKCQVKVWDDPRRDGLTTLRRIVSMAHQAEVPKRHTVIIGGQVWLLSDYSNPDPFDNYVNRKGYVAQLAKLGKVATTAQVLDEQGQAVYMSRVWIKDVKDITTSSESQSQYYVYFTHGEPLFEGEFVFICDRWHIIRNIYSSTAGFLIAECNELEANCLGTLQADIGEYDPVSETTISDIQNIPVIKLDWRDDYVNSLPSGESQQEGDIRLRTSRKYAHLLIEGRKFSFDSLNWTLVRVEHRQWGAVSAVLRRV